MREAALQNVAEYDINPKISKEVKNFFRKKKRRNQQIYELKLID